MNLIWGIRFQEEEYLKSSSCGELLYSGARSALLYNLGQFSPVYSPIFSSIHQYFFISKITITITVTITVQKKITFTSLIKVTVLHTHTHK